jgi:hypothetical protein
MKKLMEKVKLRLFGIKPANKEQLPPITFKVTVPQEKLTYEEWVKEFNVSRMWDRKIVHINHHHQ